MLRDPVVRARCAAILAVAAVAAAAVALWPGLRAPAWPGSAMGLGAVALALGPGPIAARAAATLLGSLAAALAWVQIGALWGAALLL
jgi:hypothetical protein